MRLNHPILAHRAKLQDLGRPGPWVALFDIDSTLMDTGPRNLAILEAAFEVIPALAPWRSRLDLRRQSWNVLDPLVAAGVDDPGLLATVLAFWRDRFFTDEWLDHDRPYPGVAEFLCELKAQGFLLAYLTGRHAGGMEVGTRKSLVDHGLPAGPEETFFFKPTFEMPDRDFKASVCEGVAALGTLVVTVDNEPANVNLFRPAFPEAIVVWLDTITSPNPERLVPGIEHRDLGFFLDK